MQQNNIKNTISLENRLINLQDNNREILKKYSNDLIQTINILQINKISYRNIANFLMGKIKLENLKNLNHDDSNLIKNIGIIDSQNSCFFLSNSYINKTIANFLKCDILKSGRYFGSWTESENKTKDKILFLLDYINTSKTKINKSDKTRLEFNYDKQTIKDKLIKKDDYPYKILQNEQYKTVTFKFAEKIASYIENNSFNFETFKSNHIKRKFYPISKEIDNINNQNDFLTFLRTSKNHIAILSILWDLSYFLLKENIPNVALKFEKIYKEKIITKRDHTEIKKNKTNSTYFGNSQNIQDNSLFDNFKIYPKDIEYKVINTNSLNKSIKKYIENNIPYIAGASGMANCASSIFILLELDINAEESLRFMEVMSAFIVGSGMHSYNEVYTSFNITIKNIHKLTI